MNKQSITQAIINRVESSKTVNYTSWRIGLTHTPSERKEEHENEGRPITHWQQWQADSLADAQAIESYFINEKKMQGGTGGDLSSSQTVYVYIM